MHILEAYGADARRFDQAAAYPGLTLGRIVSQHQALYRIVTEDGEFLGEVSGRFRYHAPGPEQYPAVGDFVMADPLSLTSGSGQIHVLLPRTSLFTRSDPDNGHASQVVAANIHVAFVCMALNSNYNLSRLERYLSVAWDSGATPVVVLTKADLCPDLPAVLSEIRGIAPGTDVLSVTREDPATASALLPYLGAGKTASFLGSSGVGKSTLINLLSGEERMATSAVREDGKGRHTTTSRELLLLPGGGIVIDTPGMRELGVESVDLKRSFSDIDALTEECRFRDCTHTSEPGCAVLAALASGALDARRLESYQKLKREARYDGLCGKRLEQEKSEAMFRGVGGMKKVRRYIRDNDKRKGED